MPSINLKLLHSFARVAELRSFTRAGEELGRSPSAISMQIAELEGQLGVRLLERTTRRVAVTPDGSALLAHVRQALDTLDGGIAALLDTVSRRRGRIQLASAPTVAAARLSGVLAAHRQLFPTVPLNVRELVSPDLLRAIREREVDFGITPYAIGLADLAFELLVREPLLALVPINLGLAPGAPLTISALAGLPLILMDAMPVIVIDHDQETPGILEDVLRARCGPLTVACRVRQAYSLVSMATAGLGISLVPQMALPDPIPDTLMVLPLESPAIVRDIGIAMLKSAVLSKPADALLDLLRRDLRNGSASAV